MTTSPTTSTDRPLVSVIMICWNRKDDIAMAIEGITKSNYPHFEIIAVDNNSLDGTPEIIAKQFPHVNLIRLNENTGIAAFDEAVKRAKGKYIAVFDDDAYPEEKTLTQMVDRFEQDARCGILAFHIKSVLSKKSISVDWPKEALMFWGCGFGIRKEVIDKVKFYDSDFFIYANELDLGLRVIDAGWEVQYDKEIISYHKIKEGPVQITARDIFYSTRNRIWIYFKYFPYRKALWLTLKILPISFAGAVWKRHLPSFIKALCSAAYGLPKVILKKRHPLKGETIKYYETFTRKYHFEDPPGIIKIAKDAWRYFRRQKNV